jgi:hypothetical protein
VAARRFGQFDHLFGPDFDAVFGVAIPGEGLYVYGAANQNRHFQIWDCYNLK